MRRSSGGGKDDNGADDCLRRRTSAGCRAVEGGWCVCLCCRGIELSSLVIASRYCASGCSDWADDLNDGCGDREKSSRVAGCDECGIVC